MTAGTAPRRLGVFGGAFDPPHIAHVALARAALEQLNLDELRIFPTGQAWHKAQALSPSEDRLAMVRLAFGELPRTAIDERELQRPGPTYTVDTLRELKAQEPGVQLFLIMGEDQAVSLPSWQEWETVVRLAAVCMAARPLPALQAGSAVPALPAGAQLHLLRMPSMPESATEVRQLTATGKGIAHLVPAGVARYIESNHLYQPA